MPLRGSRRDGCGRGMAGERGRGRRSKGGRGGREQMNAGFNIHPMHPSNNTQQPTTYMSHSQDTHGTLVDTHNHTIMDKTLHLWTERK